MSGLSGRLRKVEKVLIEREGTRAEQAAADLRRDEVFYRNLLLVYGPKDAAEREAALAREMAKTPAQREQEMEDAIRAVYGEAS